MTRALICGLAAAVLGPPVAMAQAQTLDQCLDDHRLVHEAPQSFSQSGSVTCPAARLGGFPPRIIKAQRQATVEFIAPEGRVIDNHEEYAPKAVWRGRSVPLTLSDDRMRVSADVRCESGGLNAANVTETVTITGRIVTPAGDANVKNWLVQCALEGAKD